MVNDHGRGLVRPLRSKIGVSAEGLQLGNKDDTSQPFLRQRHVQSMEQILPARHQFRSGPVDRQIMRQPQQFAEGFLVLLLPRFRKMIRDRPMVFRIGVALNPERKKR